MKKRRKILFSIAWYDYYFHQGVAQYAREHNWELNVISDQSSYDYRKWQGDGIVCMLDHTSGNKVTQFIKKQSVPKVELTAHAVCTDSYMLAEDNEMIGSMAADYFIKKGFRYFYYLSEGKEWHSQERFESFEKTVKNAGFRCSYIDLALFNSESIEELRSSLGKYLKDLRQPAAIFSSFDKYAELAVESAYEAGIRVPEDLAILGTGNLPLICDFASTPISSIASDQTSWGYNACKLLDKILDDEKVKQKLHRQPPKEIVERQSTNTFAVNDPSLRLALNFIHANFDKNIGVADIVEISGTPRSTLALKFKKQLGHSITEEITHSRIEHAKKLLRETDLNGNEIAKECGFNTQYYFYQVFKQKAGLTTKDYREKYKFI